MFLQSRKLRRKRETGASLQMMSKRDLTPEEQETIQKSKDSSVIMTSNDTTHTIEKGTVCALNMFVQVQFFKESPAVLSLGKLCEENGYSHEWYPGQPSYLKCKTDNHIPLVVPGVQAAADQTKTLDDWKRTQAVGDHESSVESKSTRMASTITEGLTRRSSSSTDVDRKGSLWRSRIQIASQICSGSARLGNAMDSKLSMKNQNQLKRRREIPENSDVKKKTQDPWIRTDLCFFICSLRRAELESWEINAPQIRNKWICRTSCTTLQESWWAEAMECYCFSQMCKTHKQMSRHFLNDGSSHH